MVPCDTPVSVNGGAVRKIGIRTYHILWRNPNAVQEIDGQKLTDKMTGMDMGKL